MEYKKRIFITGQCSLHWGRMENGNIGNYYITEPMIRELHRVFPDAEIVTTMQMTEEFQKRERIKVLPMELYYAWRDDDLDIARKEYEIALQFSKTGILNEKTPYIEEVLKSDLILDFSGEMWSSIHADLVGKNRFLVGVLKDRTAQLLGKKTSLIVSGEGPFSKETLPIAKETLENFDLILNREAETAKILEQYGIDTKNVKSGACSSFLFRGAGDDEVKDILEREKIIVDGEKSAGFILCGFNMLNGPYDMQNRPDEDFNIFAEAVEYIVNTLHKRVVLMSHSNGFELSPDFKLINGRDYYIQEQLYNVLKKRGAADMNFVHLISRPYNPWQTKAIIRNLEMLVSGRLHASVGGISECVPTVVIMYGHGPLSHKTIGFHKIAGTEKYIAYPAIENDIIKKIQKCYKEKDDYRKYLEKQIPKVQQKVHLLFDELKKLI